MLVIRNIQPPQKDATADEQAVILAHRLYLSQLKNTIRCGSPDAAVDALILMAGDTVCLVNDKPELDALMIDKIAYHLKELVKHIRERGVFKHD